MPTAAHMRGAIRGTRAGRALVGLVAVLMGVALSPAAHAHVDFASVEPVNEAQLQDAPASVRITFSASVEDRVREATLVAPDGTVHDDSWSVDGPRIAIELPAPAAAGAWTVRWRVLGGDGHPISGGSTFTVGEPGTSSQPAAPSSLASSYPYDALELVALVGRIAFFAGLLLFVGGMLFAMFAAPGWQPKLRQLMLAAMISGAWIVWGTHVAMLDERSALQMLVPMAWLSDVTSVAVRGYVLAAVFALAANASRRRLNPDKWSEREGQVPLLTIALVAGAAISPSLSGHASDGEALWIRVPLDMVHILAGAAWLGGLVQVLTLARHDRIRDPRVYAVVSRYARVAAVSVGVLVVTGLYATFDEIDVGFKALVDSTWGRLVLAKAALLASTMPLANSNRLRNVPDVWKAPGQGVPRLRRFVAWELVIIIWVVVATAMLVHETPPRADSRSIDTASSHSG